MLSKPKIKEFHKIIYQYYHKNKRFFPWRDTQNPYHIFISEIMLQQTQSERVVDKYRLFLKTFPTVQSLAKSSLNKVLKLWQGLGYNRRAIALHRSAKILVEKYQGNLPETVGELIELPGVGQYTAAAVCAFAYNQPTIFIETNIRRVYIHFFFQKKRRVKDKDILPLVELTVDRTNPREWYYALMDYGAMLRKQVPNPNRRSAHYTKQSRFEGSNRQIRGLILQTLLKNPNLTESELVRKLQLEKEKIKYNLIRLKQEGFLATDLPE
ncbi:MAG: A/G-specific adenine glycosylase [bacterium]|nr:A/G-specific adenine glycosylase [bacterium]